MLMANAIANASAVSSKSKELLFIRACNKLQALIYFYNLKLIKRAEFKTIAKSEIE